MGGLYQPISLMKLSNFSFPLSPGYVRTNSASWKGLAKYSKRQRLAAKSYLICRASLCRTMSLSVDMINLSKDVPANSRFSRPDDRMCSTNSTILYSGQSKNVRKKCSISSQGWDLNDEYWYVVARLIFFIFFTRFELESCFGKQLILIQSR